MPHSRNLPAAYKPALRGQLSPRCVPPSQRGRFWLGRSVTPASIETKRAMISGLCIDQLRGWYREVIINRTNRTREPFGGEVSDLINRAEALGYAIKGR